MWRMDKDRIAPEDLSELEKSILLEVRTVKRFDPDYPVARSLLARRFGKSGKEVQLALSRLHGDFGLIGPLVLDPRNVELTAQGEVLADVLQKDGGSRNQ